MPELWLCLISAIGGKYRVVRSTKSWDVTPPITMDRSELEAYVRDSKIVNGNPENVLKELDRAGIVEFSAIVGRM